jgi:8-oxo-(d)GTP phosphatase
VRVLLVRHARAGDRDQWVGNAVRPLDAKGKKQAKRLAKTLAELGATRLISSPLARCVQTFEPAAKRLGIPLEERNELAEVRPVARWWRCSRSSTARYRPCRPTET